MKFSIRKMVNPFSTNIPLLYPLKTLENWKISDVFWGHRKRTLFENGLMKPFPRKDTPEEQKLTDTVTQELDKL